MSTLGTRLRWWECVLVVLLGVYIALWPTAALPVIAALVLSATLGIWRLVSLQARPIETQNGVEPCSASNQRS